MDYNQKLKLVEKYMEWKNNHGLKDNSTSVITFLEQKGLINEYDSERYISGGMKFFNHIHECEFKFLFKKPQDKCPHNIKRKNIGYADVCDECKHLRIVTLSDEGDHILTID